MRIAISLCLVLAGCASAPTAPTSPPVSRETWIEREKSSAADAAACAAKQVDALDDGVSDAGSVALAVAAACVFEDGRHAEAWAWVYLDNEAQRNAFRTRAASRSVKVESNIALVLRHRTLLKRAAPRPA